MHSSAQNPESPTSSKLASYGKVSSRRDDFYYARNIQANFRRKSDT